MSCRVQTKLTKHVTPVNGTKKQPTIKLAKLNEDCNMTAGLEAKLLLAVRA